MNETMNILMAVNRKYVTQMKTLLCSLGCNNDCIIDVYLMYTELSEHTIEDLKQFVTKWCRGRLHAIKINNSFLQNAKLLLHFSIEIYYRIFAVEYLPENIDRILWLDADIVVISDIREFYYSDLKGYSVAVCAHREKDITNKVVNKDAIRRLGWQDENNIYFNSGVILMDLKKIRKYFNHDYTIELINSANTRDYEHRIIYPDQDILNIIYQSDKLCVDESIFNYQVHYDWNYDSEKEFVNKFVKILHFAGPVKPWDYKTFHFTYAYYWKYYLMFGRKSVYYKCKIKRQIYFIYKQIKKL